MLWFLCIFLKCIKNCGINKSVSSKVKHLATRCNTPSLFPWSGLTRFVCSFAPIIIIIMMIMIVISVQDPTPNIILWRTPAAFICSSPSYAGESYFHIYEGMSLWPSQQKREQWGRTSDKSLIQQNLKQTIRILWLFYHHFSFWRLAK